MGIFDSIQDKAKDVIDDPDKKAQIEQMAKDKGISMEEAKAHFQKKQDQ